LRQAIAELRQDNIPTLRRATAVQKAESAIAALSAPQPPAEAQPVAKLVNRKDSDGGKTTTFIRPTSLGMDLPLGEYPLHLHPSAPVGVERIAAEIRASLVRGATVCTRRRWAIELEALAQQPAAVDGAVLP